MKTLKTMAIHVTDIQELFPLDQDARSQYYRWCQERAANGLLDPELVCYSGIINASH